MFFNNNNNDDSLYKLLKVSKDADEASIKKSYREHPNLHKSKL